MMALEADDGDASSVRISGSVDVGQETALGGWRPKPRAFAAGARAARRDARRCGAGDCKCVTLSRLSSSSGDDAHATPCDVSSVPDAVTESSIAWHAHDWSVQRKGGLFSSMVFMTIRQRASCDDRSRTTRCPVKSAVRMIPTTDSATTSRVSCGRDRAHRAIADGSHRLHANEEGVAKRVWSAPAMPSETTNAIAKSALIAR
jgi:hypothetical protein